jgi:hypothetical protein
MPKCRENCGLLLGKTFKCPRQTKQFGPPNLFGENSAEDKAINHQINLVSHVLRIYLRLIAIIGLFEECLTKKLLKLIFVKKKGQFHPIK